MEHKGDRSLRCAAAFAFALLIAACGGPEQPAEPDLVEIPRPDLARVDAAVREALEEGHAAFDAVVAAGNATTDDHGRLAMLYHSNEQAGPAEAGYKNAILLAPDAMRWPYFLGRLYESEGRASEAAAQYARVLELDPRHVPTLVRSGDIALEEADNDRAAALFDTALERDPVCVPALLGKGKVALARKEYRQAVESLERALELSPDSSLVNYPLGLAYRGLGDNERARGYLEKRGNLIAGVDDPLMRELTALEAGWRVHQDRGIRQMQEEQYEPALESFKAAAAASADQPGVYTNMGTALVKLGRVDEAHASFERAVLLDPKQTVALYNLGVLAARAGDDERAMAYYARVLEGEPDNWSSHFNTANALRRLGRFDEAAVHYAAVVGGDPSNAQARLAEALSFARVERWQDALDRLEAAYAVLPENAPIRDALVRVLAAAPVDGVRDGTRARQLAEALLAEQRSLSHVEAFAMAAAEVGDFATAKEWQNGALAAAARAGRTDLVPELRRNFERYNQSQPCRRPWDPESSALSP